MYAYFCSAGQKLSDGEIQKLAELEKKENEEMTGKFKEILEKYQVYI